MTEFDNTPTPSPTYDSSKVPEEIRKITGYVRTKYKGEDILEAIAQSSEIAGLIAQGALETASYDGNSLADVTLAKDGLPTLDARIRRDVDSLENKKADKSEVTAQLAQKAKKDEVFLKEHGIDINDFNEQTRKTFLEAQGIDVNYVLGLGNVKPENTSFFDIGKNMFDKTNVTLGKYVNSVTGGLSDSASYNATDYIGVLPNTTYTVSVFYHGAFYDGDKNYISKIPDKVSGETGKTFETPANGHFIRLSLRPVDMDTFQIEKGLSSTSYEPFRQTIEPNIIPDLEDGSITVNKTNFIKLGKNLFDKSTATKGHYVNNVSGKLSTNANYYASDFIEIEGGTKYIENETLYKAFYDEDKVYISGLSVGHESPFTTPINARFLRITVRKDEIDSWQLEQNTIKTSYQPHGYYFDKNIYSPSESVVFPNQFIGITLPETIPAVVGHEVNIYFENIVCVDNLENYQVNVICSKGKQQTERWTYVPTEADIGEYPLTIEIYKEFKLITTNTTKIKVSSKTRNAGANPNVLIIGDSTTANSVTATEINTLFTNDVMDVNLIGTQGTAPALHEGRSGWTTDRFYSSTDSPFVFNGTFNFAQYLSTNGLATPDVVIINLGINDSFGANSDEEVLDIAENMISQYNSIMDNIRNVNPNTIFGICVTIPSGNQDAFSAYGSGQTAWRYKLNNRLLAKHINDYYIKNKTTRVHLIPINVCIDTVNNMAFDEETTINSRTEKTIKRQRNGVHPGVSGYEQIADMEFYWLKTFFVP